MKKDKFIVITICIIVLLIGTNCADVENIKECVTSQSYGFLGGLWHGIIAPISFIASLFPNDIAMYAKNNNGGWYDLGFILGSGILTISSTKIIRKK